jgi:hypothetical protein
LNEYNNLKSVKSQMMIPDMWHQRSLTGVFAQEFSHMIHYLRLSTGTSGTIYMVPEIYHRRYDMI